MHVMSIWTELQTYVDLNDFPGTTFRFATPSKTSRAIMASYLQLTQVSSLTTVIHLDEP